MNKDNITELLAEMLKETILREGLELTALEIKQGASYFSVNISDLTSEKTKTALLFRIKLSGNKKYISVNKSYEQLFPADKYNFSSIKSETDFIRVVINDINDLGMFSEQFNFICKDKIFALLIDQFGCCSSYLVCSDNKECVKDKMSFYRGCQYRKSLEKGKIFYGKNRNI